MASQTQQIKRVWFSDGYWGQRSATTCLSLAYRQPQGWRECPDCIPCTSSGKQASRSGRGARGWTWPKAESYRHLHLVTKQRHSYASPSFHGYGHSRASDLRQHSLRSRHVESSTGCHDARLPPRSRGAGGTSQVRKATPTVHKLTRRGLMVGVTTNEVTTCHAHGTTREYTAACRGPGPLLQWPRY